MVLIVVFTSIIKTVIMKGIAIIILTILLAIGCSSQKEVATTTDNRPNQRGGQRQSPPSVDDIFKMDANQDGKLAKSEVTGRLEKDFVTIDTDGDGFITKTELENAPKPQRGQRPQKNR